MYEKMGCIWLSSRAMLFLKTHAKVIDSLLVILFSFSRVSSPINHSSATILLVHSPTTSCFSFCHSSSEFKPLRISFLTSIAGLPFLIHCFPSFLNYPFSFLLNIFSTLPANCLFQSVHIISFPVLLVSPFSLTSFIADNSNILLE